MDNIIEIVGENIKTQYYDALIDPNSGEYRVPLIPYRSQLEKMKKSVIEANGSLEATIEALPITIIIDTGVMHDHPVIRESLIKSVDFTGEGPEDYNGHGTVVSLIYLNSSIKGSKIISVKALDKSGSGTVKNMIKAFDWAIDFKKECSKKVFINLSAGIDRKKWGFFPCRGNCKLCKTASRAIDSGIFVFVAAGNKKNTTYCPANSKKVSSVFATDIYGDKLPNSGDGTTKQLGDIVFGHINQDYTDEEILKLYQDYANSRKVK